MILTHEIANIIVRIKSMCLQPRYPKNFHLSFLLSHYCSHKEYYVLRDKQSNKEHIYCQCTIGKTH